MGERVHDEQARTDNNADTAPRLVLREDNDTLIRWLRHGQRLLTQHPQAARALVQALVAEGRRFAQTPEGQQWKETLTRSAWVQRGRLIWEAYHLDALLESEPAIMPTAWLDMIGSAAASPELETVLSSLIVAEVEGGAFGPA